MIMELCKGNPECLIKTLGILLTVSVLASPTHLFTIHFVVRPMSKGGKLSGSKFMSSLLMYLQCFLLEMFPTEGGAKDPSQRMIPFLPGTDLPPCIRERLPGIV